MPPACRVSLSGFQIRDRKEEDAKGILFFFEEMTASGYSA